MAARRMRCLVLAALLLAVAGAGARAQDYQVTAFVRPDTNISDGRPIQFIIQVDGAGSPQVRPPAIPALENLEIVGGPNTNSQFSWRNGQASSQYQLIYALVADGPGPARIPALQLEVDGKSYTTEPIEFSVQASATGPPPAPGSPRPDAAESGDVHDVFLRAELGAREVWVGQPVPLAVTLYTAERISDWGWRSQPGFSDFWVETMTVNPDAEAFGAEIGGRSYTAYPVDRKVLVPPIPGRFEVEPYVAQLRVQRGSDSPFRLFSLDRGEVVIRRTEPLELRVRQLPQDQPDGFGGAVGNYRLRATLDREETAVNDAVALRATVEGEGFLRAVEPPVFEPPPDVKVFDPKISESTSEIRGKVTSKKSWEWVIVPLTPGDLELPELRFPYFDPARGEYREAQSERLDLVVQRAETGPDVGPARGEIQLQRRDLAFIKSRRGQLAELHARAHERGLFLTLLLLPFGLFPLVVLLGRQRARLRRDVGLARFRKAGARARKRLRAVRRRLKQAEPAAFHEEVARTLVEYVADRFNRSAAGLTYEAANDLLASEGVKPEPRRRFRSCLETCDFARFVPAASKSERRAELLDQALAVIEELEKAC